MENLMLKFPDCKTHLWNSWYISIFTVKFTCFCQSQVQRCFMKSPTKNTKFPDDPRFRIYRVYAKHKMTSFLACCFWVGGNDTWVSLFVKLFSLLLPLIKLILPRWWDCSCWQPHSCGWSCSNRSWQESDWGSSYWRRHRIEYRL